MANNLNAPLNEDNVHKLKRIDQLHAEKEAAYHEAINDAHVSVEKDTTIKRSIQKAALAWEEIFKLHGQEWMIDEIGSIVVKDLKIRGFPESKYHNVYRALDEYEGKFSKPVDRDNSSSRLVSPESKRLELFYKQNAQRYYEAFEVIKNLKYDYDNLLTRDIQTIVPQLLDEYDDNEKECKRRVIIFEKSKQEGFDGGPEQYSDRISINKPIPEVPLLMTEELGIWINTFLPALLKKFTDYPIKDKSLEKRMAEGWAALRHAHDPSTDDKYRKSYYDWITIVQFADQSFKHHAASHFKVQDFRGQWRKLTREQIGARQRTVPMWCKWFFEKIPGFMEEIAWSREYREPRLSGFSIDLSPKLSDRSIR